MKQPVTNPSPRRPQLLMTVAGLIILDGTFVCILWDSSQTRVLSSSNRSCWSFPIISCSIHTLQTAKCSWLRLMTCQGMCLMRGCLLSYRICRYINTGCDHFWEKEHNKEKHTANGYAMQPFTVQSPSYPQSLATISPSRATACVIRADNGFLSLDVIFCATLGNMWKQNETLQIILIRMIQTTHPEELNYSPQTRADGFYSFILAKLSFTFIQMQPRFMWLQATQEITLHDI